MVPHPRDGRVDRIRQLSSPPEGVINRRVLELTMSIQKIAVLGAGQMGNGITQVAACAGYEVTMIDIEQDYVDNGMATIEKSLSKLVSKERLSQEEAQPALSRISGSVDRNSAANVDLVVDAIPEIHE